MGWGKRWLARRWDVPYTRDEHGGTINGRTPLLRRLLGPLFAHWKKHWQWWTAITLNACGLAVAIWKTSKCP